jgi:2,3-bisphosphoglycerate-independent phosphoglycerate mutase
MNFELMQRLQRPAESKIVLLVIDGLGGLPRGLGNATELESARTPYLDDLAKHSLCGLHQPVRTGVTPGSGPAHLALFGYDPVEYDIGRGVLEALGIGFDLSPTDVAARGNFCTLDDDGRVSDRRAGRLATQVNRKLCDLLSRIEIDEVQFRVETIKDYRFLLVLRGSDLRPEVGSSDPQTVDAPPAPLEPLVPEAQATADLLNRFVDAARDRLAEHDPANMILLRGFSQLPQWPTMQSVFGLRAAAIASYPMYRGVGALVGMTVVESGSTLADQLHTLKRRWADFDLFFVHVKKTDSAGEDGDFDRKVALIEQIDKHIPQLLELRPDVLVVTGDHTTPAVLNGHSWHPVPVLVHAAHCRPDAADRFGEQACLNGGLGPRFPATDLMPLAMANAGRLAKFGA